MVNSTTQLEYFLLELEKHRPEWLLAKLPFIRTPKGNKRDNRALRAISRFVSTQAALGGHVLVDAVASCASWDAPDIAALVTHDLLHSHVIRCCNLGEASHVAPSSWWIRLLHNCSNMPNLSWCLCGAQPHEHQPTDYSVAEGKEL